MDEKCRAADETINTIQNTAETNTLTQRCFSHAKEYREVDCDIKEIYWLENVPSERFETRLAS